MMQSTPFDFYQQIHVRTQVPKVFQLLNNSEPADGALSEFKITDQWLRVCLSVQQCNDYLLVEALEFSNKTWIKDHNDSMRGTQEAE